MTSLDAGRREISHRWPEPLPGGKTLLFTVKTADITSFDEARIGALDIATGGRRTVLEGGHHARYPPSWTRPPTISCSSAGRGQVEPVPWLTY